MKSQAYEQRNLLGFEGDDIIGEKLRSLIDRWKINWVIETGTFLGGTAKRLASMCEMVSTIEINDSFYLRAKNHLRDIDNVTMFYGDSVALLPQMLKVTLDKNILFFLDDHWEKHLPLLAELEIINEFKGKHGNIVISIHDFKVPGRPDLGFDTYGNVTLDWPYIEAGIEKIYGKDGYLIEYNNKARGAQRGIIYITPCV
jgi:hypothetical protein